jgi:hypothetical protein
MNGRDTAYAFAWGLGLFAAFIVATTPLCIWIASIDACERMFCEILIMRRPHAEVSYCQWWFDRFR